MTVQDHFGVSLCIRFKVLDDDLNVEVLASSKYFVAVGQLVNFMVDISLGWIFVEVLFFIKGSLDCQSMISIYNYLSY